MQNGFDTKLVKELAKVLRDQELSEIEIENQGTRIRVTRQLNIVAHSVPAPNYIAPEAPKAQAAPIEANPATPEAAKPVASDADAVKSPMVGTLYHCPEPGADPFIKIGDTVKEGQQLFIVEAMKTLNAVKSDRSGIVKAILVADAAPVEYGEALCIIG